MAQTYRSKPARASNAIIEGGASSPSFTSFPFDITHYATIFRYVQHNAGDDSEQLQMQYLWLFS